MHDRQNQTLSMMAGLLGCIPSNDPDFFTIRRLDMAGRKVEISSPPISSPIHCFFFLSDGEAMISIGKDLYFFHPGDCCVIPAGQVFSIRYFDNCKGYMGGFNSEFVCNGGQNPLQTYSSLRRWGYHKVSFTPSTADSVRGLMERLNAENAAGHNLRIIKAYLSVLLTEIEEAFDDDTATNDNTVCNRFLELVFGNYAQNRPLGHYAAEMNVSEAYLRKSVKHSTGKNPLEWINEAKMLEAKSLLFNTHLTVNEISLRVWIEDPAYFSRLFKKSTGMTPVQYRTSHKKSNTKDE